MLPYVLDLKQQYEHVDSSTLGLIARVICHFRQHCLIYSLLRCQLHLDLHFSDNPFLGPENPQIISSVVELVSSWLSLGSPPLQTIKRAYRFQVRHAINTLFEVVLVCCQPRNCPPTGVLDHPIIKQYNLLSHSREVINYYSKDADAMLDFGEKWNSICLCLG